MDEQSTMHERLGIGHMLIALFAVGVMICGALVMVAAVASGLHWACGAASEAFQGALSGAGVAL